MARELRALHVGIRKITKMANLDTMNKTGIFTSSLDDQKPLLQRTTLTAQFLGTMKKKPPLIKLSEL